MTACRVAFDLPAAGSGALRTGALRTGALQSAPAALRSGAAAAPAPAPDHLQPLPAPELRHVPLTQPGDARRGTRHAGTRTHGTQTDKHRQTDSRSHIVSRPSSATCSALRSGAAKPLRRTSPGAGLARAGLLSRGRSCEMFLRGLKRF